MERFFGKGRTFWSPWRLTAHCYPIYLHVNAVQLGLAGYEHVDVFPVADVLEEAEEAEFWSATDMNLEQVFPNAPPTRRLMKKTSEVELDPP